MYQPLGVSMQISAVNTNYHLVSKGIEKEKIAKDNLEVKKESKKSFSPALIGLSILAIGGIGYGIYKHNDASKLAKSLEETKKALDEAMKKLNTQEEKVSIVEKALKAANEKIKELIARLGK